MFSVVQFPGSNDDRDLRFAMKTVLGAEASLVWHKRSELPPATSAVLLPGGFSYGDYLRCGAMAQYSPVMVAVKRFADAGGPVLGICNGFQVLTECGLLPGALMRNAALKFVCRDVHLRIEAADTPFTAAYVRDQVIRVPIAHMDGNYFADEATLDKLEGEGRVAFRYCAENGGPANGANPNGSARDIAGILNETLSVLGMMPHPERLADPALGGNDGRAMFDGLVQALG